MISIEVQSQDSPSLPVNVEPCPDHHDTLPEATVPARASATLYTTYQAAFSTLRSFVLLPYEINEDLEVFLTKKHTYLFFAVLPTALVFQICKQFLLFIINSVSNHEFQTIKNGEYIQLLWVIGACFATYAQITMIVDPPDLSSTISVVLHFEKYTIEGNHKTTLFLAKLSRRSISWLVIREVSGRQTK